MKTILPAILNPISRRKDKSCLLKFDTRELSPEEVLSLLALEGTEGWLTFQPNNNSIEMPKEEASVGEKKTPSSRLRAVMYILYHQDVKKGNFVGIFDTYYSSKMDAIIEHLKNKIDES